MTLGFFFPDRMNAPIKEENALFMKIHRTEKKLFALLIRLGEKESQAALIK